ncbi:MAG: hypothetical protein KGJ21_09890 [Pseudomonadota bacterium]|nr:hypothetical protein [Pseudomonadota bacterium]
MNYTAQTCRAELDALLDALDVIETDKDGDGFICREAMECLTTARDHARQWLETHA